MTETAKPKSLWWRRGDEEWHEDPAEEDYEGLVRGDYPLWCRCDYRSSRPIQAFATEGDVKTRRTAPPVAQQCAKCRAAKARKEEAT